MGAYLKGGGLNQIIMVVVQMCTVCYGYKVRQQRLQ